MFCLFSLDFSSFLVESDFSTVGFELVCDTFADLNGWKNQIETATITDTTIAAVNAYICLFSIFYFSFLMIYLIKTVL
ncbi:putative membrane protein [Candidatus Phytoplasma solani]